MSGFGIHEQYEAGVEMWEHGKRWREETFLQQLSQNGSMMLAANHDLLWLECLEQQLGQPPGSDWERMAKLLRLMPAPEARRRLWQASYQWWMNMQRFRLRLLIRALGNGDVNALAEQAQVRELAARLELRGKQLDGLSWCLTDTRGDSSAIAVVDGEEQPQRRSRRR